MDHAMVLASQIGEKLQSGFVKLFSGEIEEDEIIMNEPEPDPVNQRKTDTFLDRN